LFSKPLTVIEELQSEHLQSIRKLVAEYSIEARLYAMTASWVEGTLKKTKYYSPDERMLGLINGMDQKGELAHLLKAYFLTNTSLSEVPNRFSNNELDEPIGEGRARYQDSHLNKNAYLQQIKNLVALYPLLQKTQLWLQDSSSNNKKYLLSLLKEIEVTNPSIGNQLSHAGSIRKERRRPSVLENTWEDFGLFHSNPNTTLGNVSNLSTPPTNSFGPCSH
jgi:hypothetical protein